MREFLNDRGAGAIALDPLLDPPDDTRWRSTPEPGLPRLTGVLRPLVDIVASIKASVHAKLLAGFLVGALLLLGMAVLSLVVIERMSARFGELAQLQDNVDRSRQMEYLITAQSHYRAMALLTHDNSNNDKIATAKADFIDHIDNMERVSRPEQGAFFRRVREANDRFTASSERVLQLYARGDNEEGMRMHLSEEHPVSHELEAAMRELQREAGREMSAARAAFESDRQLLTGIVGVFSAVSLASAMLLGFVLSWAFILPVRQIERALGGLAAGNFTGRVDVPNRDEFGTLSRNLNRMSQHLSSLYDQLRGLNEGLQQKVDAQVRELERTSALKRYVSPQLAESVLGGTMDVDLASRRKNLTVFFSDIRGFTSMSERIEPEELVDLLNEYLTAMTDIVFKYGGTLDKYIGDAVMVFFGDPVRYEDHPARAVMMAFDMRKRLEELRQKWFIRTDEELNVGMGISTGYVTVGNIGSNTRLEYTVLGNHVNLASRLADRASSNQILVSERTLLGVRDLVEATEIDQVTLEGVSRPVRIYEINEKDGAQSSAPGI